MALNDNGETIELIGDSTRSYQHPASVNLERTEDFVCIRGLWLHGIKIGKASGVTFGVMDENGVVTVPRALEKGWNDPRLHREWHLWPLVENTD
jgi:hypothetical protein